MFTGIIEEIGTISSITSTAKSSVLSISASKVLEDVHLGDSISVNGVCLTVTSFSKSNFTVDVMPETVKASTIHLLKKGSKVNLERAMAAGGRFGGHFVSGHIDGTGTIKSKKRLENAVYYEIETNPEVNHFVILKGSVAVDGTSLTVFGVSDRTFTISLIPHTLSETILSDKGPGDKVNIECDMLGKYVHHMLNPGQREEKSSSPTLTAQFLKETGFI
ncbi:riboflavin synthase subunit alpha [Bacillus sp. FJAT-27225]|uniref:riboflavin synthase n=1 Tax=Bacillus sp. FJAT-27225 TaxID=1743144 RepID=UPI00080C3251|nr:riboflavin synthase [Bacillus sp. FJAT-27225]OCA85705.1 riboflavin synthase subunit alpha [Bacillus sp. FJAT-27225]